MRRKKFRKFGLKKIERNMKEGNYTGKITTEEDSNSTIGEDGAQN